MSTDRINAICRLIKPCPSLADIGCDHAEVALYALENGVENVIASDISQVAVSNARLKLARFEGATAVLSDGFSDLPYAVDTAVISGMGGRKIIDMLQRCAYKPTLILGAQHNQSELRIYLMQNGYVITDDVCVFDRGKYYDIIRAEVGISPMLTDVQIEYGVFCRQPNADLKKRTEEELKKLESYKPTEYNRKRKIMLTEVLAWQK